jgi:hypothetical protein
MRTVDVLPQLASYNTPRDRYPIVSVSSFGSCLIFYATLQIDLGKLRGLSLERLNKGEELCCLGHVNLSTELPKLRVLYILSSEMGLHPERTSRGSLPICWPCAGGKSKLPSLRWLRLQQASNQAWSLMCQVLCRTTWLPVSCQAPNSSFLTMLCFPLVPMYAHPTRCIEVVNLHRAPEHQSNARVW